MMRERRFTRDDEDQEAGTSRTEVLRERARETNQQRNALFPHLSLA